MRLESDLFRPFQSLSSVDPARSSLTSPAESSSPARSLSFLQDGFSAGSPALSSPVALSAPEASFAPDSFGTHVYTVQSGDTLWGISQQFGTTVAHLRELNPAVQGTDVIYPGQQLVVPGSSGPPETGGQTQSYTIRSGDTMGAIAAAHGTTVDQLMRLNPWITNPNYIQAGWVIQVPAFTPAPPPPNPGPVPPGPFPPGPLTTEPNHQFSLGETWPYIKQYANQYGFDPHVLAGMVQQESGFKNYQVHFDGTGHGLLGLDDNGLLPDFEGWVRRTKPGQENYSAGRGAGASSIPPDWQLEYAAQKLASYKNTFGGGDDYAAARAWYRGPGGMNDSLGYHYQSLIQAHVSQLFANGDPPDQLPGPVPPPPPQPIPNGPIRSVDQANQFFLSQWGPTPYNSGGWPYGFNDCGPTSAAMVAEAVGLWPPSGPGGASATIDRMRDTILGYDSTYSQLMNTTQLASGLRSAGAATQMLYNADPVASVEEALGRGHPAILGGSGVWNAWGAQQRAAGNYLNSRDPGGHFVTVMGKSDDGRYIVGDPLVRNGAITVTADQLRTYMSNGFGVLEAWNPNAVPPPPPPPQPAKATFQTVTGNYMSAQNGGLNGAGTGPGANEQFDMSDLDGGDLRSGDYINLKSSAGLYVCAEFGGGQEVNANRPAAAEWERLKIVEIGGDGIIQDGDRVAFQTSDGQHWLIAQHGGGDNINSDSTIPGYFETFTYRKG